MLSERVLRMEVQMQFDASGWLDAAIEIDYLNKSMSRQGYKPTHIVLHGTAGGTRAQDTANYFATGSEPASAHFIIGQDGAIVQGVPCSLAAWGNGILNKPSLPFSSAINPNYYTISIEHCKPSLDNSDALTPAQQTSSFHLVQTLCAHYGIPQRRGDLLGGILSHADFDSVSRAHCPGPYPWDGLLAFLQETTTVLQISQVSQYFTEIEKDQRWRCKQTGQDIAYGILAFYRTFGQVGLNGLSIFGLPLSDENPVPHTKVATVQLCERGAILYDPQKEVDVVPGLSGPCYPAHIDSGLARQLIMTLTK